MIYISKDNINEVLSKITKEETDPKFLIIDLFCGAGGTTTGFEMAESEYNTSVDCPPFYNSKYKKSKIAKVIACVNHDPIAIKSHWANHPHVLHFEEDIRTLDLEPLTKIVEHYRVLYPDAYVILWASLECTNFSKAKGGQPRDADSRTLADHLPRYITAIDPDYIQIENVVEFMAWGPLNALGKPVSSKNGSEWLRWRKNICKMGYYDEWNQINSADQGAYTSRNRLFGCFAKHNLPIAWPVPSHAKKVISGMFGQLQPWKAVKHCLDFKDEGESIFNRSERGKKELVEATLKRIYAGCVKHIAGGDESFLVKYNSMTKDGKVNSPSVNDPCPTVACQDRLGLAFIQKHYSGRPSGKVISVDGPAGTVTTAGTQSLVQAFLTQRNGGDPKSKVISPDSPARTLTGTGGNQDLVQAFMLNYNHSSQSNSVENPSPTLVTKDKLAIVQPGFLMGYYGNGDNTSSMNKPAGTITTKDRFVKVWLDKQYGGPENHQSINRPAGSILNNDKHCMMQAFIDRNFSGGGQNSSVEDPAGTVMPVPKMNLISAPFIMDTSFNNGAKSVDNPHPVITADRHWTYIVNPSHGGHSTSTDKPCPVIIARQDKSPLYLLITNEGPAIPIYEGDSETMIKIKTFMAVYGIGDIKMRMLKVKELKKIQGFPEGYILEGSQTHQKKFIGNSVCPIVPKVWIEAMAEKLFTQQIKTA